MTTSEQQKLLERFAPNIRFTKGEAYLPADIFSYLKRCSLVAHYSGGEEKELVPRGRLTPEELTKERVLPKGTVLHLRLTEDVTLREAVVVRNRVAAWKKSHKNRFVTAQGRLARVGVVSRVIDALFSLTLILRGRVPGLASNLAADVFIKDAKHLKEAVYYGHVVEDKERGWIALQYWFFYYFNDWRSGFSGVNDHESDWEMATVYVYKNKKGTYTPEWVAFASHDFHGDDVRRHYLDTDEVLRVGTHPVIHAGVGSHASYFRQGEYLANFPLPAPFFLRGTIDAFVNFWSKHFSIGKDHLRVTIPFIDYARGDGISVGYKEDLPVKVIPISDTTEWVSKYKGLWGHFAQDPLSGEDAPAGPKYNRDGSVRLAWQDPFAFSGLDAVPVPSRVLEQLKKEYLHIQKEKETYEKEIEVLQRKISQISLRLNALEAITEAATLRKGLNDELKQLKKRKETAYTSYQATLLLLESIEKKIAIIQKGGAIDMRGHIANLAKPTDIQVIRFAKAAEIWASVSIGLMILCLLLTVLFFPSNLLMAFLVIIYTFSILEAIIRKRYVRTLSAIALSLVFISSLILLSIYWKILLLSILAISAIYLVYENIKELRAIFSSEK